MLNASGWPCHARSSSSPSPASSMSIGLRLSSRTINACQSAWERRRLPFRSPSHARLNQTIHWNFWWRPLLLRRHFGQLRSLSHGHHNARYHSSCNSTARWWRLVRPRSLVLRTLFPPGLLRVQEAGAGELLMNDLASNSIDRSTKSIVACAGREPLGFSERTNRSRAILPTAPTPSLAGRASRRWGYSLADA